MGIYLNPGKAAFEEAVNSEIYIDKSEMLLFLNSVVKTKQKYVSVSRPRRFGKTMAADMICAYYDREADSRILFENLKVSKNKNGSGKKNWDEHLGEFDVIRIVVTDFMDDADSVEDVLQNLTNEVTEELAEEYPSI